MTAQPGFKNSIDLIELSDAFRRHAAYPQQELVRQLVEETRNFACHATWYDPYEPFRHKHLIENLVQSANKIAALSMRLGANDVTLPVSGDPRSPFTAFFKKRVAPLITAPVDVHLQKGTYTKDLSAIGGIDPTVKTVLDQGLRGMAKVKDALKYKWDR